MSSANMHHDAPEPRHFHANLLIATCTLAAAILFVGWVAAWSLNSVDLAEMLFIGFFAAIVVALSLYEISLHSRPHSHNGLEPGSLEHKTRGSRRVTRDDF